MKNETEKLNKFKLAVFSEAQQQAQEIIDSAEKEQKQRLNSARMESKDSLDAQLEEINKEFEAQRLKEVSSRRLEAQRNILTHRSEMIDRVFENVKKTLNDFAASDKYPQELKRRIEKCCEQAPGKKGTAYFTKRDIELGRELCRETGLTAEETKSFSLGGVLVIFSGSDIAYDCTFDASLEQERADFSKNAGLGQL